MKASRISFAAVLSAICSLIFVHRAAGGPPYVTDDPEPVEYHHWEFYVASADAKSGGDWSGTAPHIEINYGVIENMQLHLIAPLAYDVPPDGPKQYGYGDTEFGIKYRFVEETNYLPQIGIFPLVEIPTGSPSKGLGAGHWNAFLPVWLQKSWGSWTAYGGGGYGVNSFNGHGNWAYIGGLLQKQITKNVSIGAEIYHQTAAQADFPNSGTAFNIGTVIDFTYNHHLLLSAGRSIDGPVDFQCYIAYQFTFDNSFFHFLHR